MFQNGLFTVVIFVILPYFSLCAVAKPSPFSRFQKAVTEYAGLALNAQIKISSNRTYAVAPLSAKLELTSLALFTENKCYQELLMALNLNDKDEISDVLMQTIQSIQSNSSSSQYLYGSVLVSDKKHVFTQNFISGIFNATGATVAFNADPNRPSTYRDKTNSIIADETQGEVQNVFTKSETLNKKQFSGYYGIFVYAEITVLNPVQNYGSYYNSEQFCIVQFTRQRTILNYYYNRTLGAQFVSLPLSDDFFEAIAIVPDDRDGYKKLAQQLADDPGTFNKSYSRLQPVVISLSLPPFSNITQTVNSKRILQMVTNVTRIFNTKTADFDGVTTNDRDIALTTFSQKIVITANVVPSTDCDYLCGQTDLQQTNVLIDRPSIIYILRDGLPLVVFVTEVSSVNSGGTFASCSNTMPVASVPKKPKKPKIKN